MGIGISMQITAGELVGVLSGHQWDEPEPQVLTLPSIKPVHLLRGIGQYPAGYPCNFLPLPEGQHVLGIGDQHYFLVIRNNAQAGVDFEMPV